MFIMEKIFAGVKILVPPNRVEDLILDPKSVKKLYIATREGIYYSGDKGSFWIQINKGLSNPNALCLALNSAKNYLFTGTNGGGAFRSTVKSLK